MRKNRKSGIITGVISALILVEVVLLTVILIKISGTKQYKEQLSLGDNYLQELDYENAELCYLAAIDIDEKNVTFEYKDYKDNSKIKLMTITGIEFIRRFLLHVLPNYFTKIKHYGILANRNKKAMINLCRILIGQKIFSNFVAKKEKSRTLIEFKCEKCGCNKFNYSFFYKRLNAT